MCGLILLGFLGFGALELTLIFRLGGEIGGLEIITLVCVTAAVGVYIARLQGAEALARLQRGGLHGLPTEEEMLQGPLIVVAGLLLMLPGFISDGLGALLLIPPLRTLAARSLASRLRARRGGEDPSVIVVEPTRRSRQSTPPRDRLE